MKKLCHSLHIPTVKLINQHQTYQQSEKLSSSVTPKQIEFSRTSIKRIVHHQNNQPNQQYSSSDQITVKPFYHNKDFSEMNTFIQGSNISTNTNSNSTNATSTTIATTAISANSKSTYFKQSQQQADVRVFYYLYYN